MKSHKAYTTPIYIMLYSIYHVYANYTGLYTLFQDSYYIQYVVCNVRKYAIRRGLSGGRRPSVVFGDLYSSCYTFPSSVDSAAECGCTTSTTAVSSMPARQPQTTVRRRNVSQGE